MNTRVSGFIRHGVENSLECHDHGLSLFLYYLIEIPVNIVVGVLVIMIIFSCIVFSSLLSSKSKDSQENDGRIIKTRRRSENYK